MKCDKCHNEIESGCITPLGLTCKACLPAVREEWAAICQRELDLPLDHGPDMYGFRDFERFSLRMALHMLSEDDLREKLLRIHPLLGCPNELSSYIKEKAIEQIPEYFSTIEAQGHERLFNSGVYRVIKRIPKQTLLDALCNAGMLQRTE